MNTAVQKVMEYPLTTGKRVALKFYRWSELDRTAEALVSPALLKLAKTVDAELETPRQRVCALLEPVHDYRAD